jgi:hypothetical protein
MATDSATRSRRARSMAAGSSADHARRLGSPVSSSTRVSWLSCLDRA